MRIASSTGMVGRDPRSAYGTLRGLGGVEVESFLADVRWGLRPTLYEGVWHV